MMENIVVALNAPKLKNKPALIFRKPVFWIQILIQPFGVLIATPPGDAHDENCSVQECR